MSGDLAAAERSVGRAPEGWQPALGVWLAHLAHRQQRSPNTVAAYLSDVARLAVHAGSEGVEHPARADRFTIRAWLATLHDGGLAGATIARKLDAVTVFYRWAQADGWIDHDPAAGLSMKRPAKPLPRPLTIGQAERLLASPDPRTPAGLRDLALLDVLYSTGCRAAELVGLDVGDVRVGAGGHRGHDLTSRSGQAHLAVVVEPVGDILSHVGTPFTWLPATPPDGDHRRGGTTRRCGYHLPVG